MWRSLISTRPPGIVDNIMGLLGDGCFFGLVPMGDGWTYGFGAVDARRFQDHAGPIEWVEPDAW